MSKTPQRLARRTDPITSVTAAERAELFSGKQRVRIIAALKMYGPSTAGELQAYTGLSVVQVDRRLPECREAKQARVVEQYGEDLMRNGYRVWEAI